MTVRNYKETVTDAIDAITAMRQNPLDASHAQSAAVSVQDVEHRLKMMACQEVDRCKRAIRTLRNDAQCAHDDGDLAKLRKIEQELTRERRQLRRLTQ